jgi:hypothetical protein
MRLDGQRFARRRQNPKRPPDGVDGPPLAWTLKGLGRGLAAVITHRGRFYLVGDHDRMAYLQCYDLATQKRLWSCKIGKAWGGGDGASPAIDDDALFGQTNVGDNYCVGLDGQLIFRAESGQVSLIEASPKGCNLLSHFRPEDGSKGNEPHWAHPVVSHGLLFLRQHDQLNAYDLRKK